MNNLETFVEEGFTPKLAGQLVARIKEVVQPTGAPIEHALKMSSTPIVCLLELLGVENRVESICKEFEREIAEAQNIYKKSQEDLEAESIKLGGKDNVSPEDNENLEALRKSLIAAEKSRDLIVTACKEELTKLEPLRQLFVRPI